ncbi:MAG: hypothetical protein ACHQ2Z_09815, partial [Elusimicrobiota bacterium]
CMRLIGRRFMFVEMTPEAEAVCRLASSRYPENPWPYSALYLITKDVVERRRMEKSAVDRGGMIGNPTAVVAWYFQQQGDLRDLDAVYEKIKGREDGVYTTLTELLWRAGDREGAMRSFQSGVENGGDFPSDYSVTGYSEVPSASTASVTAVNYRNLAAFLRARRIPLIAMQYPRLPASQLSLILEPATGVVVLGNESNFERALTRGRYADYFSDDFGWFPGGPKWGHCTFAGNRLISENVAAAVFRLTR